MYKVDGVSKYVLNFYCCFICNNYSPKPVDSHSFEASAFKAGWIIKLDNGQAKVICPSCIDSALNLKQSTFTLQGNVP